MKRSRGSPTAERALGRRAFLAYGAAALTACARNDGPYDGYVFVANEEGKAVAVVDLRVLAVVRHIRLDDSPTALIWHPTLDRCFALTPASGKILELDADSLAISRTAVLGAAAHSMLLEPGGGALWVLSQAVRRLWRVPIDSFRIEKAVQLDATPDAFDLSETRGVVSLEDDSLATFDLMSGTSEQRIRLSNPLGAVRFRSDGRHILAGQRGARLLSIFEAESGRTVAHLPLALEPERFCFNQDGGQLFVAGQGMDAVAVVYPYNTEVVETALAGHAPGAMAASRDFLFIASPQAGDVSIFEIESRKVIAVVGVGAEPVFIAVTPSGKHALVLNRQSGDVAILLIPLIQASRSKRASLFTMIPVGSKPVCAAVQRL